VKPKLTIDLEASKSSLALSLSKDKIFLSPGRAVYVGSALQ
jgi:hypothetical protein